MWGWQVGSHASDQPRIGAICIKDTLILLCSIDRFQEVAWQSNGRLAGNTWGDRFVHSEEHEKKDQSCNFVDSKQHFLLHGFQFLLLGEIAMSGKMIPSCKFWMWWLSAVYCLGCWVVKLWWWSSTSEIACFLTSITPWISWNPGEVALLWSPGCSGSDSVFQGESNNLPHCYLQVAEAEQLLCDLKWK